MPGYKRKRSMSTSRPYRKPYKSRTRRAMGGYRGKRFSRSIRNAVLSNTETKYFSRSSENVQLYHNGGTAVPGVSHFQMHINMLSGTQGLGQTGGSRIGDSVYGKLLSIKVWLSNKADRPNVMYRLLVVSLPPDQVNSNTPSNFFRGEIGNRVIDSVNTDKYKIIKSKLIKPSGNDYSLESGATNREKSTYTKMTIPLKNRMINYETDNSTLPSFQKNILGLVIIAYDAYGTPMTDNIASCSITSKFYYKDP